MSGAGRTRGKTGNSPNPSRSNSNSRQKGKANPQTGAEDGEEKAKAAAALKKLEAAAQSVKSRPAANPKAAEPPAAAGEDEDAEDREGTAADSAVTEAAAQAARAAEEKKAADAAKAAEQEKAAAEKARPKRNRQPSEKSISNAALGLGDGSGRDDVDDQLDGSEAGRDHKYPADKKSTSKPPPPKEKQDKKVEEKTPAKKRRGRRSTDVNPVTRSSLETALFDTMAVDKEDSSSSEESETEVPLPTLQPEGDDRRKRVIELLTELIEGPGRTTTLTKKPTHVSEFKFAPDFLEQLKRTGGTCLSYTRGIKLNKYRNRHEALSLASFIDQYRLQHSPDGSRVFEMIVRRYLAVIESDQRDDWSVADRLELETTGTTLLSASALEFMRRETNSFDRTKTAYYKGSRRQRSSGGGQSSQGQKERKPDVVKTYTAPSDRDGSRDGGQQQRWHSKNHRGGSHSAGPKKPPAAGAPPKG